MSLDDQTLRDISRLTLEHYQATADAFREGTWEHDVSQNIDALLRHIQTPPPHALLDFGCGPGRDLCVFKSMGHQPVGLDGCPNFVAMARQASGCEVLQQDFLALELPTARFDGIYANASLFHIPRQELPRVLAQLHLALRPGGVLFASNPRGENSEGWNGPRYGAYHDWEHWKQLLETAGFEALEHYYRPAGLPREQQPWLASVWRKA
ncbi:class I SAM-dependent methyltransferase [Pseudomonas sp. ZM23]|uniref:Class I SAM-dependent methyltransferase n=1 Tax=Pseudomonas triclosanedens TaxID=2961893 RepID=A0ABY6ZRS4_9PSED|nr:class I SAM-dependent methyltransferase [Pseudomonas triclosanedens]MCP8466125.1 class I SAM-dependent methyltransferase [Pseudomonas triclosanedens]MCP8472360.1 class I SAM-dependent methyltransferase [Pseudomonas triclosanedens]MCP8477424.1 class I SAM-dependent methyltransferase [Pseudomonas triclosanedens]WAI47242.1 class I SAM-dependent methyltransferase [Pseudomonas triclosanedens]